MAKPGGMPVGNQKGLGELWSRLRFLFMAIIIYRIGTHIPVPGFDPDRLAELFNQNQGTFLGLFNMFSGGALERLSILALGVMPYISASIIMQLLSATVPSLEQLKKEGDSGRRTINRYTRYGTVLLATIQGSAMAVGFGSQGSSLAGAHRTACLNSEVADPLVLNLVRLLPRLHTHAVLAPTAPSDTAPRGRSGTQVIGS